MTHLIVLDCEAVQALGSPAHPKHRRVLILTHSAMKKKGRAATTQLVVPTAVRVEAGWDRTSPAWALPNQLRIGDVPLDGASASVAASIRTAAGVSVADAHLGAAIQRSPAERVTVITSDPGDMRAVAGDRRITIVVI